MKVVQINTFPYKATGSIMMSIHDRLQELGHDSYVVWGRGRDAKNEQEIVIKNDLETKLHGIYTRLTDKTGFASNMSTRKLLQKLDEIKPDIIHLHNIHGYYLNIELLFEYIKSHNIRIIWTLHDCWPFTGHCAYFDKVGCDRWKTGCYDCPQKHTYPASKFLDNSKWNWERKKELFTGVNIVFVTPSEWLKKLVKQSFFKTYPVYVIHNGIDRNVFKPKKNNIRDQYDIGSKKIILGVASEWTERKGLKDFIELAEVLPTNEYQIILVGVNKKQKNKLGTKIMGIQRTSSKEELVEFYSCADFFVNPTYEDNFPTTNIEAMACGTPVITYDTGGSPETIKEGQGYVVQPGNVEGLAEIIMRKRTEIPTGEIDIYDKKSMLIQYLNLYDNL